MWCNLLSNKIYIQFSPPQIYIETKYSPKKCTTSSFRIQYISFFSLHVFIKTQLLTRRFPEWLSSLSRTFLPIFPLFPASLITASLQLAVIAQPQHHPAPPFSGSNTISEQMITLDSSQLPISDP